MARVLGEFFLRVALRASHHDGDAHDDLQIARGASGRDRLRAQRVDQLARAFLALARHEHAFGMSHSERLAASRRSRLEQHRRALR
jgi:hypothetical protein